jgi:hypothetical protein
MRLFGWFRRKPAADKVDVQMAVQIMEKALPQLETPVLKRPAPQTAEDREPWRNPKPWDASPHNPKNRAKTGLEWTKGVPIDGGKK